MALVVVNATERHRVFVDTAPRSRWLVVRVATLDPTNRDAAFRRAAPIGLPTELDSP